MRRLAVLILVVATLAACRPEKPPPDATATTATTPTILPPTTVQPSTTTTIDVTAPPTATQLQDPAYWNAVLAALNRVVGEAVRHALRTGRVDQSDYEALQQVFGPETLLTQYEGLKKVVDGQRDGVLMPPGDAVATVSEIMKARSDCAALVASIDYSKVNSTVPIAPNVVKLSSRKPRGTSDLNATPWMIDEFFIIEDPNDGRRMCVN